MSLLDDEIIIDPLPSLIVRYLKSHGKCDYMEVCQGVELYYKMDRNTGKLMQIPYNKEGAWFLMWSYANHKIYVTRWMCERDRFLNHLVFLKHTRCNQYSTITLKDVIDEYIK